MDQDKQTASHEGGKEERKKIRSAFLLFTASAFPFVPLLLFPLRFFLLFLFGPLFDITHSLCFSVLALALLVITLTSYSSFSLPLSSLAFSCYLLFSLAAGVHILLLTPSPLAFSSYLIFSLTGGFFLTPSPLAFSSYLIFSLTGGGGGGCRLADERRGLCEELGRLHFLHLLTLRLQFRMKR